MQVTEQTERAAALETRCTALVSEVRRLRGRHDAVPESLFDMAKVACDNVRGIACSRPDREPVALSDTALMAPEVPGVAGYDLAWWNEYGMSSDESEGEHDTELDELEHEAALAPVTGGGVPAAARQAPSSVQGGEQVLSQGLSPPLGTATSCSPPVTTGGVSGIPLPAAGPGVAHPMELVGSPGKPRCRDPRLASHAAGLSPALMGNSGGQASGPARPARQVSSAVVVSSAADLSKAGPSSGGAAAHLGFLPSGSRLGYVLKQKNVKTLATVSKAIQESQEAREWWSFSGGEPALQLKGVWLGYGHFRKALTYTYSSDDCAPVGTPRRQGIKPSEASETDVVMVAAMGFKQNRGPRPQVVMKMKGDPLTEDSPFVTAPSWLCVNPEGGMHDMAKNFFYRFPDALAAWMHCVQAHRDHDNEKARARRERPAGDEGPASKKAK